MTSKSELSEINKESVNDLITDSTKNKYKWKPNWTNIFFLLYLHYASIYGLLYLPLISKWTFIWNFVFLVISMIAVTAGSHRLWSHRSYKAKWPLRLLLMIFHTIAFNQSIYNWVRDHRVHHKFVDTDADPYNARRGFFFSHIGWLMIHKHPDVLKKGATIDISDIMQDPFVVFQFKYYLRLMVVLNFIVSLISWWLWNESLLYSWHCAVLRICIGIHCIALINSAAHMWGMKPYNKSITPVENAIVAFLSTGEGWHNYHHTFPWDYKAAELGNYRLNITTAFIDFFAYLGWAYDLKTASPDIVKKCVLRNNKETVNSEDIK